VESFRRSNSVNLFCLGHREYNIFFGFKRLNGALLDDFDNFWLAVGINLLIRDGLDKLAVVFENGVHFVLELNYLSAYILVLLLEELKVCLSHCNLFLQLILIGLFLRKLNENASYFSLAAHLLLL
jgi:hypothetical protein